MCRKVGQPDKPTGALGSTCLQMSGVEFDHFVRFCSDSDSVVALTLLAF